MRKRWTNEKEVANDGKVRVTTKNVDRNSVVCLPKFIIVIYGKIITQSCSLTAKCDDIWLVRSKAMLSLFLLNVYLKTIFALINLILDS